LVLLQEYITMHGPLDVKYCKSFYVVLKKIFVSIHLVLCQSLDVFNLQLKEKLVPLIRVRN
jgi:hypothetical protein